MTPSANGRYHRRLVAKRDARNRQLRRGVHRSAILIKGRERARNRTRKNLTPGSLRLHRKHRCAYQPKDCSYTPPHVSGPPSALEQRSTRSMAPRGTRAQPGLSACGGSGPAESIRQRCQVPEHQVTLCRATCH